MADAFWALVSGRLQVAERSQAWLARRLGVSRSLVNQWMLGRTPAPSERQRQVAGLLDIRADELDGDRAA